MIQFEKCFVVWLLLNFHSQSNCDSFYSLALYRQVLLVIYSTQSTNWTELITYINYKEKKEINAITKMSFLCLPCQFYVYVITRRHQLLL